MEKNPYLTIMIQSLKKKSAVLDAIIELKYTTEGRTGESGS